MASQYFSNGPSRKALWIEPSQGGRYSLITGVFVQKSYQIGELWGSVDLKFAGIIAGSSLTIIRTYDNSILASVPSVTANQEVTIDWYYPQETNNIQIIITLPGYYFISSTLDLEYSAETIIFLIDQLEVAVGINVNDIATAVWDKPVSEVITASTMGLQIKTNLDATISSVKAKTDTIPADPATETTLNAIYTFIQNKVLLVAKFLALK